MKMSKRIFIVLLTFAVMISSFALFASANEEEVAPEFNNFEYLLEYYEEPVIFGYDFGAGDFDYSGALIMSHADRVTHSVVTDTDAPGGKYLNIEITENEPWGEENLYLSWNGEGVDKFFFDATVSAGCLNLEGYYYPKYRLIVGGNSFTDVSKGVQEGVALLTLDFSYGQLSYKGVNEEGKAVDVVTDFVLTVGDWYNVSLTYNYGEGASITVTNVADEADTITVSDVYLPYETVKNVRFGVHAVDDTNGEYRDANGNVIKIASMTAAGGTVRRNVLDSQKGLEDSILELYEVYTSEDIAIENKTVLCTLVNNILAHGFTSESKEVNLALDDIKFGSVTLYSNALANGVKTLESLTDYYDKRQCVDDNIGYADTLSDMDLSPVGEEAAKVIKEQIDTIYAMDAALKQAELDSLEYIELLSGMADIALSDDYSVLDASSALVADLAPDLTYEGVAEVHEYYLAILDKKAEIESEAEIFIDAINKLSDSTVDFMVRYNDYLRLKDNIYGNETYPGVTEALAKYNDEILPDISYNISLAENFVKYVERADFASYISAKEENIKIADEYMDLCHPDFEGVAEAKELRLEILEYIEVQKANAKAYVDAVNALDSLTGDELTAGIKLAQSLQKTGNVLGVEGVTEANVKLNKLVSSIELRAKYANHFISLVEELNYLYKAEDLYNKIVEAKAAERIADQTYPGVSEASVDLDSAIENYNAMIDLANEEFVIANLAAANTVGIGESSNSVADHVIAIIQTSVNENCYGSDEEEEE